MILVRRQATLNAVVKRVVYIPILIAAPVPNDEMAEEAPVAGPTHTAEEKDQSKRNKDHKQDNLQSIQNHFPH